MIPKCHKNGARGPFELRENVSLLCGHERDGFLGSDHCPNLLKLGGEEEGAGGSGGKKREAGEGGASGGGGGGGGGDKKRAKVVARHQLAI